MHNWDIWSVERPSLASTAALPFFEYELLDRQFEPSYGMTPNHQDSNANGGFDIKGLAISNPIHGTRIISVGRYA